MPTHPDTTHTSASATSSWYGSDDQALGDMLFQRLSRLVLRLLHVPLALLTLVNDEYTGLGTTGGLLPAVVTPFAILMMREYATLVARAGTPLAISDVLVPGGLGNEPAVHSIAYLGVPIVSTDMTVVGVINVIANGPRQWSSDDISLLDDLAAVALPTIVSRQSTAMATHPVLVPPTPFVDQSSTLTVSPTLDTPSSHEQVGSPYESLFHESLFRSLIEQALDIIMIVHLDGTIQYSSPSVRTILGYRVSNVVGTSVLALVHPSDRVRVRKQFVRVLKHPETHTLIEVRVKHQDGSWRMLEALGKGHRNSSGERSVLVHVRDVTERVRMQESQQRERSSLARRVAERTMELSAANIELARSARIKDEFLASVSHELRTPLNIVLGLTEALQEEVYGVVLPRQIKVLQDIASSGQHLLVLINNLLDLSKLEAGKLEIHYVPIDIADVCQSGLQMIMQEATQKQLQVTFTRESTVTHMLGDKLRLRQMLFHLLSNAVKFTPARGAIGLDVRSDPEHDLVRFSVWDDGIGIARDQLQQLFQPFVQLDSGLARQYSGAGLGLVLVNRLVELHGGGITVESEIGHGSRFTLWLPWRTSTPQL